jgi:uncharacterized protein (DUF486 family)
MAFVSLGLALVVYGVANGASQAITKSFNTGNLSGEVISLIIQITVYVIFALGAHRKFAYWAEFIVAEIILIAIDKALDYLTGTSF